MKVIICEKPAMCLILAKFMLKHYPNEDVTFLSILPYTLMKPVYPKGTSYSDLPAISEPVYQVNKERLNNYFVGSIQLKDGLISESRPLSFAETQTLINAASQIINACDSDETGAWGFTMFLDAINPQLSRQGNDCIITCYGTDEDSLIATFSNPRNTESEFFQALLNAERVKRYFDYNFNQNAQIILGDLYRRVSRTNRPVVITKEMLQLLLKISTINPRKGVDLQKLTQNWKGSGRYEDPAPYFSGLGSLLTRPETIKGIYSLGLISISEDGLRLNDLTGLGQVFVRELHPKCCDPDLPFRINAWMSQPMDQVRGTIDSYIKRFFGRQKTFSTSAVKSST